MRTGAGKYTDRAGRREDLEIIEVEMRYHMPDDVDVSLRYKMRSFTNCTEDLKRENAGEGSWEPQKKDDEPCQGADVTAPL